MPSPRILTASLVVAALAALPSVARAETQSACTLVASTAGDDAASGTPDAPFRTVGRLVQAAGPGVVACLEAGATFTEDVTIRSGGSQLTPFTLRSAGADSRATLVGRLYVADSANDVVIRDLNINGKNDRHLPSPTINGDRVSLLEDDITNDHTGICIGLGHSDWGAAVGTVIDHVRIHDCGRVPSTNYDHGIYMTFAIDTRITNSVIDHNTDRGIQLYPNAQRTVIAHNVIDSNGEGIIFSGDDGHASSDTTVTDNIITNSRIRHDVESWYPAGNPLGTDNVVGRNCIWHGARGEVGAPEGFSVVGPIVTKDPLFRDPASGDYRLQAGSPCAGFGPAATHGGDLLQPVDPVATTPDVTAPTAPTELIASRAGSTIRLRWTPAVDDTGVAFYLLRIRSRTIRVSAHRSSLTVRIGRSQRLRVALRARDAAGRTSPPATATVR